MPIRFAALNRGPRNTLGRFFSERDRLQKQHGDNLFRLLQFAQTEAHKRAELETTGEEVKAQKKLARKNPPDETITILKAISENYELADDGRSIVGYAPTEWLTEHTPDIFSGALGSYHKQFTSGGDTFDFVDHGANVQSAYSQKLASLIAGDQDYFTNNDRRWQIERLEPVKNITFVNSKGGQTSRAEIPRYPNAPGIEGSVLPMLHYSLMVGELRAKKNKQGVYELVRGPLSKGSSLLERRTFGRPASREALRTLPARIGLMNPSVYNKLFDPKRLPKYK